MQIVKSEFKTMFYWKLYLNITIYIIIMKKHFLNILWILKKQFLKQY